MIYHFFFITLCLGFYCSKNLKEKKIEYINFLFIFILILFTGLRHEVGGDWFNYLDQYNGFKDYGLPSIKIFKSSDPLYIILCILSDRIGTGIYGVNFFISSVFMFAFYSLIKQYEVAKYFTFLFCASFLFFLIFLMMGYSRQCLSISFLITFLICVDNKNYKFALLYFFLSLISHKSIVIFYTILFFFNYLLKKK